MVDSPGVPEGRGVPSNPAQPDPRELKRRLRGEVLARRAALTGGRRDDMNAALLAHLAAFLRAFDWPPRAIAAYYPVGPEPGGRLLIDVLQGEAERVYLPVSLPAGELKWGIYRGRNALTPAVYHTLEPPQPHVGPEALAECAAIVVPAVAISAAGVRLGHGGGYYDRTLGWVYTQARSTARPRPVTIGIVYEQEFGLEVPREIFDAAVDVVVTDRGVRDLRGLGPS